MREKNRNNKPETEAAFALSLILMNILLIVVAGGVVWLVHLAINSNSELNTFFRGGILP
jgi:hypothetical protein